MAWPITHLTPMPLRPRPQWPLSMGRTAIMITTTTTTTPRPDRPLPQAAGSR